MKYNIEDGLIFWWIHFQLMYYLNINVTDICEVAARYIKHFLFYEHDNSQVRILLEGFELTRKLSYKMLYMQLCINIALENKTLINLPLIYMC